MCVTMYQTDYLELARVQRDVGLTGEISVDGEGRLVAEKTLSAYI